ncbi:MAG TPA: ferredoxin reductase family protein [Pedococcus sp.]|nr:ferredoxin reductase family protein [Pedococcus sp.]
MTSVPTRSSEAHLRQLPGPRHDPRRLGRSHLSWRRRVGDLLEVFAVASLVLVLALFFRSGGSHDLVSGGWSTALISIGRATGLVAVDLLLIQLLLAARVPWVDRVYGTDRALKAHRVLGRITVPLVLVHMETLVLGYAARDHRSAWFASVVEPFVMLRTVPDMLTAFAATALLVVIAVTSVRLAMRAMGYERWHLVHLTAYAAVALSIPHQLSIGSDLSRSPAVRAYWLGLYLLVAGSIAWWRFLVPVCRSLRHRLRVEAVVEEAPGVWSVWVRGRQLEALDARAGQFFNWRFNAPGLRAFAHPWSLSSMPKQNHLRLTVRDLGDHSRALANLRPGTRVLIEGPYGAFTTARRTRRRVLLIAAGIGITPIRALAEELAADPATRPGDITIAYRANAEDQLALRAELEQLTRAEGHTLHLLTGPPVAGSWFPGGQRGHDDAERLRRLLPDPRQCDVYLCGPVVWMDLVHTSLLKAGVPRLNIHDERFSW